MLSKLEYNLKFTNGNAIQQSIEFTKGSTLITGKNGKGKSLNFEMVGFALFGSKALRGQAGDYKGIKVTLDISIAGKTYEIKRTKSKAEVFHEGEPVASGTKAANTWVLRTLGYGFDVFRIAHWCAQGDIQALASMKPTERKQMIDSVAGLTQMDSLEQSLSVDARTLRSAIDSATQHLVKPDEPTAPEAPPLDQIESSLTYYNGMLESWLKLSNLSEPLAPHKPDAPTQPELPPEPTYLSCPTKKPEPITVAPGLPGTVSQASQLEHQLDQQIAQLNKMDQDIQFYEDKYVVYPELPEFLESREQLATLWENYERGLRIQALESQSQVECPHCRGTFHLSEELVTLKQQPYSFNKPEVTLAQWDEIQAQEEVNRKCEALKQQRAKTNIEEVRDLLHTVRVLKADLIKFDNDSHQFNVQSEQVSKMNEQNKLNWENQVAKIEAHYKAQSEQYAQRMAQYENHMAIFNAKRDEYQASLGERKKIADQFPTSEPEATLRSILRQLGDVKQAQLSYQQAYARYEQDLARYNEGMVAVEAQRSELDEVGRARQALKEVKSTVQSHLLPSLNKVASSLMNEMTGGELKTVEVGQDFEVTVDGQPMRTLSGSGKDLANLTLRIGLGRILTHRVLPLMMLDEIDSAMDDVRASYTWQCIERITPHIGQVLQASHKELDAQNRIEV